MGVNIHAFVVLLWAKKIDKAPPPLYNMEHEQRRSFSEQELPALKTAVFAFLIYSERKVKDL